MLKILSLYKSEWRTKNAFPVYQSRFSIIILDWQIHLLCTATEGWLSRKSFGYSLLWCEKEKKWNDSLKWNEVFKFIRHSQNWDLSHNIIIIVRLECHHTKTVYCMSLFRWNIEKKIDYVYCKKTNVFWPVLISIYVPVWMYFMCIAYYFFSLYVYISVPICVFILIMNPGFNRYILCIKLDVLFLCFVRNDKISKL